MVVVESAEVLRQHVERLSRGAHSTAIDAVAVSGTQNVWPGFVDLGMNRVGSCWSVKWVIGVMVSP